MIFDGTATDMYHKKDLNMLIAFDLLMLETLLDMYDEAEGVTLKTELDINIQKTLTELKERILEKLSRRWRNGEPK